MPTPALIKKQKRINFIKTISYLIIGFCLSFYCSPLAAEPFRMGILPVLDTLPLQVGVAEGYFQEEGLEMELVMFNSAMERNTAIHSGQLDGMFGDILATLLLAKNGVPVRFMTISYETNPTQRMFGLMTAPGLKQKPEGEMSVAISRASIIEYLLGQLGNTPETSGLRFKEVEIKKMPLRVQMLLTNQIDSALLPEPLASLAESKGAKVVVTDQSLDMPLTVLALHWDSMKLRRPFMKAYTKAVVMLNAQPEKYRDLMVKTCRIPKPLINRFPVYEYPIPRMPTAGEVNAVQTWMLEKGLLSQPIPYTELIPDPNSSI